MTGNWKNRIVGHEEVDADQLLGNERNPRIHPKYQQDALTGVLDDIGWIQDVIVNKRTSPEWGGDRGIETLVDGHLRVLLAISKGAKVPVKYVDLSPEEERLALATFDPISALAGYDAELLDGLLQEVNSDSPALQRMLSELAVDAKVVPPNDPYAEWVGMPEFEQDVIKPFHSIRVDFSSLSDVNAFAELVGQTVTEKTTSIYFPAKPKRIIETYVNDES